MIFHSLLFAQIVYGSSHHHCNRRTVCWKCSLVNHQDPTIYCAKRNHGSELKCSSNVRRVFTKTASSVNCCYLSIASWRSLQNTQKHLFALTGRILGRSIAWILSLTPEDGDDFHGIHGVGGKFLIAKGSLFSCSHAAAATDFRIWLPLVDGRMFKSTSIYGGSKLENNGETTLVLFTVKQYKTKLNQDFDKNSMIHSLNHDSWLRSWIMLTFLTHRLFEMFNRPTHLGRIPWLPESSAKTMVGQWSNGEQVVGLFQLLFHWIKVVKLPCFTPRYSDLYLG